MAYTFCYEITASMLALTNVAGNVWKTLAKVLAGCFLLNGFGSERHGLTGFYNLDSPMCWPR